MKIVAGTRNLAVLNKFKGSHKDTRRGIRRAFFFIGKELTAAAKLFILRGPKTGKLYRVSGRKKRHRASAPGESPANLTGVLRRSIGFELQGDDEMEFGAEAGYSGFLELGTKNLAARPYLIRAIKEHENNFEKHLERELKSNLESK